VLESNKANATALCNLSVIVSKQNLEEAIQLSCRAMEAATDDSKFGYTHAFFLNQNKKTAEAIPVLKKILAK